MFKRFEACFKEDAAVKRVREKDLFENKGEPRLKELLLRFGGASFNRGIYRVMNGITHHLANEFIAIAFPNFSERVVCFGYDWLGRIFALDGERREDKALAVLMFEPGTGEVLEIPSNLVTFHNNILVDDSEAALAFDFHKRWLALGGAIPKQKECVGYKQPLFLSGEDQVENLEISDLDVYWTLSGQLIDQVRGLSPGTQIGGVELSG
jgi:hypothetical protein